MNREYAEKFVGVRLNDSFDTAYVMWGDVTTVGVPVYENVVVGLFGGIGRFLDVLFALAVEELVGELDVEDIFWSMSLVTGGEETDEELDYCDTVLIYLVDFSEAVCQVEDEREAPEFKYHIFYDNDTVFIVQGDTDAFEAYDHIASCNNVQRVTVRNVDG